MMKKGFTLSEVLITLGIVGVIAAMTVPAIMNIRPDEVKMKFIKAYGTLTSITNEVLGDSSYYWIEGYNANGEPLCRGLNCLSATSQDDYNMLANAHPELGLPGWNSWSGSTSYQKLTLILASKMNLQSGPICNNGTLSCTFTTTDGTWWSIYKTNASHVVHVDTDTSNDLHLSFANNNGMLGISTVRGNQNLLKDVDTFKINIDNITGRVSIADDDILGQDYIKTPTDIKRSLEKRKAAFNRL